MTTPKGITGPQDLAQTVRSAADPLDDHAAYGISTNSPDDELSRAAEMKQLLAERSVGSTDFLAACEEYIAEHPARSMVLAATAGAACTALIFAVADWFDAD